MAARYAWIIDKDHLGAIGTGTDNHTGIIGPYGADTSKCIQLKQDKNVGSKFRLFDDDGELYYEGRIIGKYDGFEPLDDIGEASGCTYIEYFVAEKNHWAIL